MHISSKAVEEKKSLRYKTYTSYPMQIVESVFVPPNQHLLPPNPSK